MTSSGSLTVLSTFDDAATARRAVDALAQEGFLPENMRIEPAEALEAPAGEPASPALSSPAPQHGMARIERFFERLLGRTEHAGHAGHAADYSEAVRTGRSVAIVDTSSEVSAERAATVMQDFGAYDLTQRRIREDTSGSSTTSAGTTHLPSGTVVRWRSAHVVYRPSGEPLRSLGEREPSD